MDDAAWDHSTYTKNRDRLIAHEVVRALCERVMIETLFGDSKQHGGTIRQVKLRGRVRSVPALLYEVENRRIYTLYYPSKLRPVRDYVALQGRY